MSVEPRIVKTEQQYQKYLAEIELLAASDPDSESPEGARLELLAKLAEDYEKSRFVFQKPDPIEAILFRMEERGLKQKDIAAYLGGKNRASEILSGKRPLTVAMIRSLHENLHIPSELLIREPAERVSVSDEYVEEDVPLGLMRDRGWIESGTTAAELIKRFLAPAASPVLLRHTQIFGTNAKTNRTRIQLWLSRIREVADSRSFLKGRYDPACLNHDALSYIARLSWMDNGPRLAMEFLAERGIALVIEPHLPATRLDGAALLGRSGAPVIGMTIRHDRLDNFWYTLMHELVHAWKHLNSTDSRAIADEGIEESEKVDPLEKEANDLAAEILIPRTEWRRSQAFLHPSQQSIAAFAQRQQVNPAIIAGRIRYERKNYSIFAKLVGNRQVRICFPEVKWS